METFSKYVTFVIISVSVSIVAAQSIGFGKCPRYSAVKNFNATKFEGKWYEVERSFYLIEIASSCTSVTFAKKTGGMKVVVKTVNRWTGSPSVSLGTAATSSHGPGIVHYKVNTKLPPSVARLLPGAGLYTVLDTDYDNYALIWSCSDMAIMHADLIWVLGRNRELPVSSRADVYNKLSELRLDSDRLYLTRHNDCPVF